MKVLIILSAFILGGNFAFADSSATANLKRAQYHVDTAVSWMDSRISPLVTAKAPNTSEICAELGYFQGAFTVEANLLEAVQKDSTLRPEANLKLMLSHWQHLADLSQTLLFCNTRIGGSSGPDYVRAGDIASLKLNLSRIRSVLVDMQKSLVK
jgi:hypothetical protein